jgi:hypothetical protein
VRFGELYMYINSVNLTHEGISVEVYIKAKSYRRKWSKDEAVDLVASHFRRGEWVPLLTIWLGDGNVKRGSVLRGKYELVITSKEPWRLGLVASTCEALVATGKEAFVKLREAADVYGELLDLLRAHKWIYIKLAADDAFRAAAKQNKKSITVASVVMHLRLVSGRGGSPLAEHYTRDIEKALEVADKLKAARLRPNVMKSGPNYVVYIAMAEGWRSETATSRGPKGRKRYAEAERDRQENPEKTPSFSPIYLCQRLTLDSNSRGSPPSGGSPPGPRGPKPRIPSRVFLWPLDDRARCVFFHLAFKLFDALHRQERMMA